MENHKPPFHIPGEKVFRQEATDATHEAQFFQLEGLVVDKDITLANLKGILTNLYQKLLGEDIEIQFRPSFFPFTEPSAEIFMKWRGKWLEMGGAGLVHPKVLKSAGIDSKEWRGFAFGPGLKEYFFLNTVFLMFDFCTVEICS